MPARAVKINQQTETEVAVLQVKVENIEQDVSEIKSDIKSLADVMTKKTEDTHRLIKDMAQSSEEAHKSLGSKISSLEKWRWMMMGAGIVIGSLGFDTVAKLLK
jgi:DNA repair exonuclease SbcCD ATPase subunit